MTGAPVCEHEPKVARGMCRRCYGRQYYREKVDYREQVKAHHRAQRAANPESYQEYNKAYYAENREQELARRKAWTAANEERQRKYNDAYRRANLDKAVVNRHRRRAREKAAGGRFTIGDWRDLLHEFDSRCAYCQAQRDDLVVEHMTPLSRGGSNDRSNIVPSCYTCNARKGTRTILEFLSAT